MAAPALRQRRRGDAGERDQGPGAGCAPEPTGDGLGRVRPGDLQAEITRSVVRTEWGQAW